MPPIGDPDPNIRPVSRADAKLPVHTMQTFGITAPKSTHYRKASCREVDCTNYKNGWRTTIDVADSLGRRQAAYIREHSGRSFSVSQSGTRIAFTFRPGQSCFAEHKVPLERDPIHFIRGGDWREHTSRPVVMKRDDWLDKFANHQQQIHDRIKEG
jgi:hypothetical protein